MLRARRKAPPTSPKPEIIIAQESLTAEIDTMLGNVPRVELTEWHSSFTRAAQPIVGPAARTSVDEPPRPRRGPNGSNPDEIATAALLIVQEQYKPMTRFELIEPIEKMELTIGGVDKLRNLGTILWRSGRFVSTGEGYWPKGTPPPHLSEQRNLEDAS